MAFFDPARCSKFDVVGTTSVWRGNIPINANREFAYHEMVMAMDLDPDVALIDVSLIDNVHNSERPEWDIEIATYGVPLSDFPSGPNVPPQFNQPKWRAATLRGDGIHLKHGIAPGSLVWWPIEGGHDSIVLGPDPRSYNFIGLIEFLGVLRRASGVVLYVHCMNGTDRTGAVVAGYAMRHLGMSQEDAIELADSVRTAGTMSPDYQTLVTAYGQWLQQQKAP